MGPFSQVKINIITAARLVCKEDKDFGSKKVVVALIIRGLRVTQRLHPYRREPKALEW
jgi:hypothetical protein